LAAPAEAVQQVPDPGRVVADAELLLDHFGDPPQRPQIGRIPVREDLSIAGAPVLGAARSSTWAGTRMGLGLQAFLPRVLGDLLPPGHRRRRDTESPRQLAGTVPRFEQRESLKSLTFEFFGVSRGSHA
jgi:hypothetical protein